MALLCSSRLSLAFRSLQLTTGNAESEVVAGVAGVIATAVRDAAVDRVVVPTPATDDAVRAIRRPSRITLRIRVGTPMPIPAPLPHIPCHVIEPITVWSKTTHRRTVGVIPHCISWVGTGCPCLIRFSARVPKIRLRVADCISPHGKFWPVSFPRAAFSHSASVGRR